MGDKIRELPSPSGRDSKEDLLLLQEYLSSPLTSDNYDKASDPKMVLVGTFLFLIFGNCGVDFLLSYLPYMNNSLTRLMTRCIAFSLMLYIFTSLM